MTRSNHKADMRRMLGGRSFDPSPKFPPSDWDAAMAGDFSLPKPEVMDYPFRPA